MVRSKNSRPKSTSALMKTQFLKELSLSPNAEKASSEKTSSIPEDEPTKKASCISQDDPTKEPKIKDLKKIKKSHNQETFLIPQKDFVGLVREVTDSLGASNILLTVEAMNALQESTEMHIVRLFEDAFRCATHAQRSTVMPKDMYLARLLRGEIYEDRN